MDCEVVDPEEHHDAPITPFIAPEVRLPQKATTFAAFITFFIVVKPDNFSITNTPSRQVLMSSQHTPCSNVWSAGVLLYVLLSQHWPFFGNNKEELIQCIFSGQYFVHSSVSSPPIYQIRQNIPTFSISCFIVIIFISLLFCLYWILTFFFPQWSVELQNLLSTMLCLRPSARLTASQLLHHPWFKIAEMCDPDLYQDYSTVPPTSSSSNTRSMNEK